MKKAKKTQIHALHVLIIFSLAFGFLAGGWFNSAGASLGIKSGTKIAAGPSIQTGPLAVGLPQWNGQDFSIVPSGWISIPLKELPVGWYPPKIYPLPRDLDRDFEQNEQHKQKKYYGTEKRGTGDYDVIIRQDNRQYKHENANTW